MSKCYVTMILSNTMNDLGYVYLDEEEAKSSCDKLNREFNGSSNIEWIYLTTEIWKEDE